MVVAKLPWFILTIIGLSFLLLVVAFRSLLIPATAAVMNLLAAAASFGVLTAFFQWGWGTDAFGLGQAGPVEAFLPVVTLAILFGLSMDYQVFLVSRMNEERVHGRRNSVAVRTGQVETGRVITAAATIMICVFLTFSFMGSRDIAASGHRTPRARTSLTRPGRRDPLTSEDRCGSRSRAREHAHLAEVTWRAPVLPDRHRAGGGIDVSLRAEGGSCSCRTAHAAPR